MKLRLFYLLISGPFKTCSARKCSCVHRALRPGYAGLSPWVPCRRLSVELCGTQHRVPSVGDPNLERLQKVSLMGISQESDKIRRTSRICTLGRPYLNRYSPEGSVNPPVIKQKRGDEEKKNMIKNKVELKNLLKPTKVSGFMTKKKPTPGTL